MDIFSLINDKNVLITGGVKTGKTELLRKSIKELLLNRSNISISVFEDTVLSDFNDIKEDYESNDFNTYNAFSMYNKYSDDDDIIALIYSLLLQRLYTTTENYKTPLVIIIDNAERLEIGQLERLINTLSKLDKTIKFIVSGKELEVDANLFDEVIYTDVKDGKYLTYFKIN